MFQIVSAVTTIDWTDMALPIDDIIAAAIGFFAQFNALLVLFGGISVGAYLYQRVRGAL